MRVFGRVVANSHALARHLTEAGITTTDVVHHGVPVGHARPPLGAIPLAGFAGRLVPEKGADVLVRAFAAARERVPDARLRIVGDGPSVAMVRGLAGELGVRDAVEFRGHVARDALDEVLGACWVQAVPSRWHEPFGIVAAEAMMRGTAVVASDAGGLAEQVVPNETGFLVPPGDVPALATALALVLSSRERAEHMGASARDHAQRYFSLPRIVDDFLAIFDDMLATPSRDRPAFAARSFIPVA
jgi:glycosyltransferase involved in cell wall biosynthesis